MEEDKDGTIVDLLQLEVDVLRNLVRSFDDGSDPNRRKEDEDLEDYKVELIEELVEEEEEATETIERDRTWSISDVLSASAHLNLNNRTPTRESSKEVVNTITRKRRFWLNILDLNENEEHKLATLTDVQWKQLEESVTNKANISKESFLGILEGINKEDNGEKQTSTSLPGSPSMTHGKEGKSSSPENDKGEKALTKSLDVDRLKPVALSPPIKRKASIKNLILKRGDRSLTVNEKLGTGIALTPSENAPPARARSASVSLFSKKKDAPTSPEIRKSHMFTVKDIALKRIPTTLVESIIESPDDMDIFPVAQPKGNKDFWLELGKLYDQETYYVPKLEDTDKYEFYFRDSFFALKHVNFIGMTETKEYVLISTVLNRDPKEEGEDPSSISFKCLIRTTKSDDREDVSFQNEKVSSVMSKKLKSALSHLSGVKKLYPVESKDLAQDLLKYELKLVVQHQKIGLLLMKEGQKTEEEMFNNSEPTPNFEEFLAFLGDKITLNGHKGFAGGLDVKRNATGINSIYTTFKGLELMFHVSTMLPHFPLDAQQVEKKRHIGNDIVVVIFNDSQSPYLPSTIKSEYNHIYFVVQPLKEKSPSGKTLYRCGVACKAGTPPFGPLLPEPAIFEQDDHFREVLLTKLVNAERASLDAPSFASKMKRTRKILLEEIGTKYFKKK